jgi:formate hydrogenlyase transcriptional activator
MKSADRTGIFEASAKWMHNRPQRYGVAFITVALSGLIRYGLGMEIVFLPPFFLFFPGIIVIALLGGLGPGVFATTLSAAVIEFLFLPPTGSLAVAKSSDIAALIFFALAGIGISWAGDQFRRYALRLQEFQEAVEGVEEMIVVLDKDFRYLITNRAFLKYRETEREKVIGKKVSEIVNPELFRIIKPRLDECLSGKVVEFEMQYPHAHRGKRDIFISYSPLKGPSGVDRIAVVMKDITEKKLMGEALRHREEAYRQFVARSSEGIFREDLITPVPVGLPQEEIITRIRRDAVLSEGNDALARMYGFNSAQEMIGKRLAEMLIPDDPDNQEMMREFIRSDFRVVERTSHEVDRQGKARVIRNSMIGIVEDGALVRTWGIQRDVTEEHRLEECRIAAEAALRAREAHFRELVEQASDGIFIADASGRYLDVNSAGAEMLGYTRQEILNLSIAEIVTPEDIARIESEVGRFAGGATVRSDWTFCRKDGSRFPGEVMGRQLSDGRLQAIVRDMTDRKRAEETMRRNEERFRVALKDSPITVFNQDSDLRYTWIYNPHVYWQQDAIGKTDEELLSVKKAAHLTTLKKRVLKTGVAEREEVTVPHNGASYFIDMTVEPLFDSDGRVAGITGSCMDIARLREAAERLQDAKDKLAREKSYLENEIQTELGFEEIIGHSSELRDVLKKAKIVAPTDSTVLLLGETGTGKELVARSVHALSGRRDRTFIKLNCAAVPSGLLESELFGHEKGAFTSAVSRKVGRIELADKGTLFLDEIGELPLELQPKLLRVLQDREFERLGGVQTLHVDVRIIAATNRDLQHDIAQKNFREDLFYRLNVFPIELPPLRERQGDISVLVRYFVKKHSARMGKHVDTISDETMRILENWNWPGNIRELENLLERMVIMSKSRVLAPPPAELQEAQLEATSSLTALEREHIIRILRETNGVLSGTSGAANRLGLKRTTLQSMLKRLNIPLRDYRRSNGTYEV